MNGNESILNDSGASREADPAIAFFNFGENSIPHLDLNVDKREIGRAHYQLGKIHYDKADLDLAETYFEKALACAEAPGDTFSMFKILGFFIRIASEKLENEKAAAYIQKSEELVDDLTTALGSLNAEYFYNLGIIKNYSGKFEEARGNFELAFKKSKEGNEPDLLAKTLLALAINSHSRKQFEESLDYLNQLDELLKIVKKGYLNGAMFLFAAKIYTELNMFDKAIEQFEKANQVLQDKKCWNLYGYILLGKGIVYKKMGQFEKALTFFKLAHESTDRKVFKRLTNLIEAEIQDVNDSSVDLYLDKTNRKVKERSLGTIDFKHRFVLLEILFLLAKSAGSYFDKDELASLIWKDEYNPLIHDKLIYTSVSRLRKLIEPKNEKGQKRKYIVRGKDGYTFNPLAKIRFQMESKVTLEETIGNVELASPV